MQELFVPRGLDRPGCEKPRTDGWVGRDAGQPRGAALRGGGHLACERRMARVTLVDANPEEEVPFRQDEDGKGHYSEQLASREAIDTPIGHDG